MLVEAADELPRRRQFVGINIRDASADNARGFERNLASTYPSLYDPGGEALLAFSGSRSARTASPARWSSTGRAGSPP